MQKLGISGIMRRMEKKRGEKREKEGGGGGGEGGKRSRRRERGGPGMKIPIVHLCIKPAQRDSNSLLAGKNSYL
jgi:hypothetical protein